jgi:O-antigen/teichoic acid export membrane protein
VAKAKVRAEIKIDNPSQKRIILENTAWLLTEKAVVMGGGLLLSIFIARYLGPESFGRYSYLVSFVSLFAPLFALGMFNVLLREFARAPDKIANIITTCLTSRLLSGLLFTLLTCVVLIFIDDAPWKFQPLAILLIANISNAFEVYGLWFQHKSDNKTLVIWRISCFALFALLKALVIFRYQAVLPLIWLIAAELVIKNMGYKYLYHRTRQPKGKFERAIFDDIFSQTKFLILSSLAAVVYLKIDILMLESMRSAEEVGVYAVAAKLSEVWYILPQVVITAFFPKLLEIAKSDRLRYYKILQQGFDLLFISALVFSVMIYFIAPWVIQLLYGEAYREAIPILRLHIFASLFIFMRVLLSQWLVSERFAQFSLVSQLSGAVINVLLNLILIPIYGAMGAAIATLVSYAVTSYFCLFLSSRTRVIARMMSKAMVFPFRLKQVFKMLKR